MVTTTFYGHSASSLPQLEDTVVQLFAELKHKPSDYPDSSREILMYYLTTLSNRVHWKNIKTDLILIEEKIIRDYLSAAKKGKVNAYTVVSGLASKFEKLNAGAPLRRYIDENGKAWTVLPTPKELNQVVNLPKAPIKPRHSNPLLDEFYMTIISLENITLYLSKPVEEWSHLDYVYSMLKFVGEKGLKRHKGWMDKLRFLDQLERFGINRIDGGTKLRNFMEEADFDEKGGAFNKWYYLNPNPKIFDRVYKKLQPEEKDKYHTIKGGMILGSEELDLFYESHNALETLAKAAGKKIDEMTKIDYVFSLFKHMSTNEFGKKILFDNTRMVELLVTNGIYSLAMANIRIHEFVELARYNIYYFGRAKWFEIDSVDAIESSYASLKAKYEPAAKNLGHETDELANVFSVGIINMELSSYVSKNSVKNMSPMEHVAALLMHLSRSLPEPIWVDHYRMVQHLSKYMPQITATKTIHRFFQSSSFKMEIDDSGLWYEITDEDDIRNLFTFHSQNLEKILKTVPIPNVEIFKPILKEIYAIFTFFASRYYDKQFIVDRRLIRSILDEKGYPKETVNKYIDLFVDAADIKRTKLSDRNERYHFRQINHFERALEAIAEGMKSHNYRKIEKRKQNKNRGKYPEYNGFMLGSERLDEFYNTPLDEIIQKVKFPQKSIDKDILKHLYAIFTYLANQNLGQTLIERQKLIRMLNELGGHNYNTARYWVRDFAFNAGIETHRIHSSDWYRINIGDSFDNVLEILQDPSKRKKPVVKARKQIAAAKTIHDPFHILEKLPTTLPFSLRELALRTNLPVEKLNTFMVESRNAGITNQSDLLVLLSNKDFNQKSSYKRFGNVNFIAGMDLPIPAETYLVGMFYLATMGKIFSDQDLFDAMGKEFDITKMKQFMLSPYRDHITLLKGEKNILLRYTGQKINLHEFELANLPNGITARDYESMLKRLMSSRPTYTREELYTAFRMPRSPLTGRTIFRNDGRMIQGRYISPNDIDDLMNRMQENGLIKVKGNQINLTELTDAYIYTGDSIGGR